MQFFSWQFSVKKMIDKREKRQDKKTKNKNVKRGF